MGSQIADPSRPRKLLEQVRDVLRVNHYSSRTEEAYTGWIRRFILYHGKKHPREMGALEVELFLTHLAVGENVATSTQKQAPNALVFSTIASCKNRLVSSATSPGRKGRCAAHSF